jgi:hypothetical protein
MRSRFWICLLLVAACSDESDGTECGQGTVEQDGICVPGEVPACGAGTHQEGNECVADQGLQCGDGTREQDGACVPVDTWYDMRSTIQQVTADGVSRIPLMVIGEHADGSPADELVVFDSSRPGAVQFLDDSVELGPLGTTVYFRPCAASEPDCAGPVELRMYLAGDLENPVATLELELVDSAGVYSPASCLVGGNAMFFDGNGYIYDGTLAVTDGEWSVQQASGDHLSIHLEPTGQENGSWWDFEFTSRELDIPLMPGVYEMAERYPFESPGRPGMDVTGDGRGCNTITGRFQVHEYERTGAAIESVTVSFEQYCDGSGVLFGCVHVEE